MKSPHLMNSLSKWDERYNAHYCGMYEKGKEKTKATRKAKVS